MLKVFVRKSCGIPTTPLVKKLDFPIKHVIFPRVAKAYFKGIRSSFKGLFKGSLSFLKAFLKGKLWGNIGECTENVKECVWENIGEFLWRSIVCPWISVKLYRILLLNSRQFYGFI